MLSQQERQAIYSEIGQIKGRIDEIKTQIDRLQGEKTELREFVRDERRTHRKLSRDNMYERLSGVIDRQNRIPELLDSLYSEKNRLYERKAALYERLKG